MTMTEHGIWGNPTVFLGHIWLQNKPALTPIDLRVVLFSLTKLTYCFHTWTGGFFYLQKYHASNISCCGSACL